MSSGVYTFTVSANDLVQAALRQTGRFSSYDTIPTADQTNVLQALNMLIKGMVKNQKPLWCIQQVQVPLTTGTATYNLSTITGTPRPLRILNAFVRNSVGQDTFITIESRSDYEQLGMKSSPGAVNQVYYDPQLGAGMLYVYNVPADSTYTLFIDVQRPVQDFNVLTDNPDFPQEAYMMLKWNLADEIKLEYLTPADMRAEISQKAKETYESFFAEEREEGSVYFTPTERVM